MLVWALCFWTLAGCDSYLDVNPKGTLEQEKQFEDVQGYRDAMYGIYATMAKTSLYGEALSWGFVDWLAQLSYDKYMQSEKLVNVKAANQYKYDDPNLEGLIGSIWGEAYQCISYANNVLENIETVNLAEDPDYALIKGEAYGVRAMLHFDLLRLFAENILLHPDAGGIPYAYHFDLKNKEVFSLKESYDNILGDLTKAEACLVNDNEMNPSNAGSDYRVARGTHCNKYAVWALQARVFHYKGDLDSAAFYAGKVIDAPDLYLVPRGAYGNKEMKRFPRGDEPKERASSEMIWGLYTRMIADSYKNMNFENIGGSVVVLRDDIDDVYDISRSSATSEDARYKAFFAKVGEISSDYFFVRLLGTEEDTHTLQGVCLIRLPEMYYILAEATYDQDKEKAMRYFNDVRNSRGLNDYASAEVTSREEFMELVLAERYKEFWGEGQTFFSYKRENKGFKHPDSWDHYGEVYTPSSEMFVLPWPKKELEFGGTNKD